MQVYSGELFAMRVSVKLSGPANSARDEALSWGIGEHCYQCYI